MNHDESVIALHDLRRRRRRDGTGYGGYGATPDPQHTMKAVLADSVEGCELTAVLGPNVYASGAMRVLCELGQHVCVSISM